LESSAPDPANRRTGLRASAFVAAGLVGVAAACGGTDDGPSTEPPAATVSVGHDAGAVATSEPGAPATSDVEASDAEPAATSEPGAPAASDVEASDSEPAATSDAGAPAASEPEGVQPIGFTTAMVRITEVDGAVCDVCVWLADVADERSRGLMGVTDLGDAAGMLFVYPSPVASNFYMFQTPRPLSIAWFAEDGTLVGESDMAPCLGVPADECERYGPGAEYLMALEVWEGELPRLGIGAGASLELIARSEAVRCSP
jgi:hypothetical protein